MKKIVLLLAILVLITGFAFGGGSQEKSNKVVIAQQFGLGYAPLMVIQEKNLIQKYYPDAEVEWVQLGSGGAIREAMAAGNVDIGSMGVPPFLIAWAKNLPWKVISGLCYMPLGMQTYHEDMKTLEDVKSDMKIALPSPGSIQHILLSMAAEKQLGDALALDDRIIAMPHPDGANALINQVEIDAHFTSPPYIFLELQAEGIHQVVDAEKDSFGGPFTFLVSVSTKKFKDSNPELFSAVFKALQEAIEWLNNNPEEASVILGEKLGVDEEEIYKQLTWPGVKFDPNPNGMLKFLDFMERQGYVEKKTNDAGELIWGVLDEDLAS